MPSFSFSVTPMSEQRSPVVALAARRFDTYDTKDVAQNTDFAHLQDILEDDAKTDRFPPEEVTRSTNVPHLQTKEEDNGKTKNFSNLRLQTKEEDNAKTKNFSSGNVKQESPFSHAHQVPTLSHAHHVPTFSRVQDKVADDVTHLATTEYQPAIAISSEYLCDSGRNDKVSDKVDKEAPGQTTLTGDKDAFNQMMLTGDTEDVGTRMNQEREQITQRETSYQEEKDGEQLMGQEKNLSKRKTGEKESAMREGRTCQEKDTGKEQENDSGKEQEKDIERHEAIKEEDTDDGDESEALDGGWAYAVLLGTLMAMISVGILSNCFSILFMDFLNQLGTSSTVVAGIYNTESCLWSAANLLGGTLAELFGWRVVAFTGSLLIAAGVAASAFATSASYLFFSHSCLSGLGSGLICLVSFAIIPYYFKRLRGRANAVMTAGICLGGTFGPPVITFLQEEYGFKAATILVSAFLLNNFAASLVYHPVSWHKPKQKPAGKSQDSRNQSGDKNQWTDAKSELIGGTESRKSENSHAESWRTVKNNDATEIKEIMPLNTGSKDTEKNNITVNNHDTEAKTTKERKELAKTMKVKSDPKTIVKEVLRTLIKNIGVLKYASAALVSVGGSFIVGVFINFMMLVPFAMEFEGYSQEQASWSMSIFNLCNLLSRFLVSPLADLPRFSVRWGMIFHVALVSVSIFVLSFVSELVWINVMLGVIGYACGSCMCLYPLLMVETVGTDRYIGILGVSGILNAIWIIVSGPLFGVIRDLTGSYRLTFCVLGSSGIFTIILFFFLPAGLRYDAIKEQQERLRQRKKELGEGEGGKLDGDVCLKKIKR